ncbi:MAG: hypothetical protein KKB12_02485, partial [Candidatus Omnitrophica bacterium]|nr:hypothetical protein [Candidatus Omnitrophota bacterium]
MTNSDEAGTGIDPERIDRMHDEHIGRKLSVVRYSHTGQMSGNSIFTPDRRISVKLDIISSPHSSPLTHHPLPLLLYETPKLSKF